MSSGEPIVSGGLTPFLDGLSLVSDGLLSSGAASGMTPFESREGLTQGRLKNEDGSYSVWLGDSQEGHLYDLAPGDFVELWQEADVTAETVVGFEGAFKAPRSTPDDRQWRLSLVLDGVTGPSIVGWPGLSRDFSDLALDVSQASGVHRIAIRLTLEAA